MSSVKKFSMYFVLQVQIFALNTNLDCLVCFQSPLFIGKIPLMLFKQAHFFPWFSIHVHLRRPFRPSNIFPGVRHWNSSPWNPTRITRSKLFEIESICLSLGSPLLSSMCSQDSICNLPVSVNSFVSRQS